MRPGRLLLLGGLSERKKAEVEMNPGYYVLGAVALAAIILFFTMLPDLIRYIKISSM